MNLFKNRPLAFFCFIFITLSVLVYGLSANSKLVMASVFFFIGAVLVLFAILLKKVRMRVVFCAVCCFTALLAVMSQFLIIDEKREREEEFEGERTVKFIITEEKYFSEYSSEYAVKIHEIDGESVSIESAVIYFYPAELCVGDEICARVDILPVGESVRGYVRYYEPDVYIQMLVYEPSDSVWISGGNRSFDIILNGIRADISEYFDSLFGEKTSALARGFLLGDTSDISGELIRDFRRAGVSHLLAISGLHISVLMGACEFLLRKLCVRRGVRCVVLSFVALSFLALTGFSMSASRSVIMLLCVYFGYLFVRENDSVTFLFASVALIMLISPHAVKDIGLWLSFLATLGIVSVYVPISAYLHRWHRGGVLGILRRIAETVGFALLLTFICNIFICLVVWLCFGEISSVSLLSNIILSPLSEIFIIAIPISVAIGMIPVIGIFSVKVTEILGEVMTDICEYFSSINGAVISLRYDFVVPIVILMSMALAVMLVINLKRKWTIMIPPAAACIAFIICFIGYSVLHRGELRVTYFTDDTNEALILTEGYSAVFIDISSGAYSFTDTAEDVMAENMATEIDSYVITHYHSRHISTLERMVKSSMLRKIHLPEPTCNEDIEVMIDIVKCAERYGVDLELYGDGDKISLLSNSWGAVFHGDEKRGHAPTAIAVGHGGELLTYADMSGEKDGLVGAFSYNSNIVILGHHGSRAQSFDYPTDNDKLRYLVYGNKDTYLNSEIVVEDDTKIRVPVGNGKYKSVGFILK